MKKVTFAIVLLLQYRKSEGDRAVNNLHWCACHNEPTLRHRQKKKKRHRTLTRKTERERDNYRQLVGELLLGKPGQRDAQIIRLHLFLDTARHLRGLLFDLRHSQSARQTQHWKQRAGRTQ